MIKTIIFDFGGVLMTNDWHMSQEFDSEICKEIGITKEQSEKSWIENHVSFFLGEISEDEFWRRFFKTANAKNPDTELAKSIWRKHQKPVENMFSLLEKLKNTYTLAGLSDITKEWFEFKRDKWNLMKYFKYVVTSADAGALKPNKKIYEKLLNQLKANPEECLFIDNTQIKIEGAGNLGIKTILFKNQNDLEKDLRKIGIIF